METSDHEPEIWIANNEPVAIFFLHLPETIGWPGSLPIRDLLKIGPRLRRNLGANEDEREFEEGDGKVENLIRAHVLASSIIFRHVPIDLAAASGLDATMAAVELGLPNVQQDLGDHTGADSADETPPHGNATIAEVAIPLQTHAAITATDRLEDGFVMPDPEAAKALIESAFDTAVQAVTNFQAAYHAVTRQPVTLLTRELLPSMVPYALRTYLQIATNESVEVCLFLVNGNISRVSEMPTLEPEQIDAVFRNGRRNPTIGTYLDLHNQGAVALGRGNAREAAVMFAAASEALLNIVLSQMRWEEGLTPEQSAADWPEGLATRVKTQFSERLGGDWNLGGKGAVGGWARDVAAIRHRVVHAGYLPSRMEAEQSASSLENLLAFIGDRLVYGRNLRRYPRTASELLNETGLRRRDRYPKWLQILQLDPAEPLWHECFGAWYETHLRPLADGDRPRVADEARSELLCVYIKAEEFVWVLRDPLTQQAAVAESSDTSTKRRSCRDFSPNPRACQSGGRREFSNQHCVRKIQGCESYPRGAVGRAVSFVPTAGRNARRV